MQVLLDVPASVVEAADRELLRRMEAYQKANPPQDEAPKKLGRPKKRRKATSEELIKAQAMVNEDLRKGLGPRAADRANKYIMEVTLIQPGSKQTKPNAPPMRRPSRRAIMVEVLTAGFAAIEIERKKRA